MARRPQAAALPPAPDFGARVERLDLKAGETLVLTLDRSIATPATADALRDYVAAAVPAGVKVLILDDRVSLRVLSSEAP